MSLPSHRRPATHDGPSRRMTKQKRAIYENVMQRCDHPTAQDIHADLEPTGIGLATVYRNLAMMAEDGLISTVEHEGELRYDCNNEPHAHATCDNCGALWDIPLPAVDDLAQQPLATVDQVDLMLRGCCHACTSLPR